MTNNKFKSFSEFYPYYLSEHKLSVTKIFNAIGSISGLTFLIYCIINKTYYLLPYSLIFGYGFAWFSHYFFEKNKPATFKYPIYSFIGDWVMLKDIIIGKIKLSK